MLKKAATFLLLILILTWIGLPVAAASGEAGQAVPILRFGVGARAFAMGGAYIAVTDDPSAVYWNPAGLAGLETATLTTMHSELFEGTTYDYLGWALPVGNGGFGINFLKLNTPGIINTEGPEDEASTQVLYFGYGWRWGQWRTGLTAKYLEEDLLGEAASAWSLDWGLQANLGERWRFGLMLQDLLGTELEWGSGYRETIPINYRVGLAYQRENLLLCLETEQTEDFQQGHFGLEYEINDFLRLRAGVRGADLTTGVGLGKGIWEFDYAYCAGDLGNTHRLSFSVKFE